MQVRCTNASSAEADQLLSFLPNSPVSEVLSADIQNLLHQFLEVSGMVQLLSYYCISVSPF